MEIISLKCNNCGADLDVGPKTTFLNCTSCGSLLAIKKSANTVFTEVLDEVRENTEQLVDQSEQMLLEKKIARLDREWNLELEKYKIRSKYGSSLPEESTGSSIIILALSMLIVIPFMIFWITNAPSPMKPFGIGLMILIIVSITIAMTTNSQKRSAYQTAKEKYLKKRAKLLAKLEKAK